MKFILLAILLGGCCVKETTTKVETVTITNATESIDVKAEKLAFDNGVICAILAHGVWVNKQLKQGMLPSVVGPDTKEWKDSATNIWFKKTSK